MGNDLRSQLRRTYTNISTSGRVLATDDYSVTPRSLVANKAKFTTFIQRIVMSIYTDNAATQQFQSITTDLPIAETAASPGLVVKEWDFGDEGVALPEGEGLELINSAAGLAYVFTVEGYRKQSSTCLPSEL